MKETDCFGFTADLEYSYCPAKVSLIYRYARLNIYVCRRLSLQI